MSEYLHIDHNANPPWIPVGTGRCPLSALTNFLSTAPGIQSTGQTQLVQTPDDTTVVLSGSFAAFMCASGFTNMGGSLNLTCNADGMWSQLPNCVMGGMTTGAPSMSGPLCPYSSALLSIPNGFASNWTGLMLLNSTHALSGSFIDYLCMPPFTLAGNSRIMCSNGAWSAQPTCMGKITKRPSSFHSFPFGH